MKKTPGRIFGIVIGTLYLLVCVARAAAAI